MSTAPHVENTDIYRIVSEWTPSSQREMLFVGFPWGDSCRVGGWYFHWLHMWRRACSKSELDVNNGPDANLSVGNRIHTPLPPVKRKNSLTGQTEMKGCFLPVCSQRANIWSSIHREFSKMKRWVKKKIESRFPSKAFKIWPRNQLERDVSYPDRRRLLLGWWFHISPSSSQSQSASSWWWSTSLSPECHDLPQETRETSI